MNIDALRKNAIHILEPNGTFISKLAGEYFLVDLVGISYESLVNEGYGDSKSYLWEVSFLSDLSVEGAENRSKHTQEIIEELK